MGGLDVGLLRKARRRSSGYEKTKKYQRAHRRWLWPDHSRPGAEPRVLFCGIWPQPDQSQIVHLIAPYLAVLDGLFPPFEPF